MAPATGRGGVEQRDDFLGFTPLSKSGDKKNTPKRKRMNRNKKKTWKKHIDVQDVEEFMDDVRLQERTAGGLLEEKADENLFFVDTGNKKQKKKRGYAINLHCTCEEKGGPLTRIEVENGDQASQGTTVLHTAPRKIKKHLKPLRIDLILQPDSKVPPPKDILSHQVPNAKKLKRKRELEAKLRKRGILPRKDRLLLAQQGRPSAPHDEANNNPSRGFYDLWAEKNPLDSAIEGKDQWYLEQTRKCLVKRPERLNKRPSELPAVEVAAPGASYNPSFESHQTLLLEAHKVEVKKLKEEKKLERQLTFPTRAEAPTEESKLQELCEGLIEESDDDNPPGGEAEHKEKTAISLPRRERKTERQRKKEKEAKFLKTRQETEKTERLRRQELFQLKSIQTSLKSRQEALQKRKNQREEKKKARAFQPKRLGRLKYKEADMDIQLSEELTDSLRKLKPEGSVIKERFKSFQKRNLIEPRERAKFKRKLKVKYVEKRAFREVSA